MRAVELASMSTSRKMSATGSYHPTERGALEVRGCPRGRGVPRRVVVEWVVTQAHSCRTQVDELEHPAILRGVVAWRDVLEARAKDRSSLRV